MRSTAHDGRRIFGGSRISKTYRLWNPNQQWLLPPCPQDWLPQDDLVYFLLDTVHEMDLSALTQKYEAEERGYPPYHPRMMVALLFYAYCRGLFSSRKIMQACEERLTFRVIVGDDIPDFRTISDFRKLHLTELSDLFLQVLRLCQEAGLVRLGHIALDGTKIKANASRHKAMSYGRMKEGKSGDAILNSEPQKVSCCGIARLFAFDIGIK